jgi:choline dehydrogenase
MAYSHTTKGALAKWASDVGDTAYAYDNAQRLYRKSTHLRAPPNSLRFANATPQYDFTPDSPSAAGPLDLGYANYAQPWTTWVAKAMQATGIPNTVSFVNGKLMGSAWIMGTISPNGHRASAAAAFATPFLSRPNLRILDQTLAERVLFDKTKKATGVRVSNATGAFTLTARKEVILAAGVFQTPQLLMLSGVGPKATLAKYAIPVVADRPGVGSNLQDHVYFGISYRVQVRTTSSLMYGTTAADAAAQWNANGTGLLSSPGGDYFGFEKLPASLRSPLSAATQAGLKTLPADWPELQYVSLPAFAGALESSSAGSPPDGYQYATLLAALVAPGSVGSVSISSANPKDQPVINPNWLTSQRDTDLAVAAFKRLRQILSSSVIKPVEIGPEYYPGAAANVQTDAQILQQVKRSFQTMFHGAATCKMGKSSDANAVVDASARVYGVTGRKSPDPHCSVDYSLTTTPVRIVDASAFPFLPPGLPQSTVCTFSPAPPTIHASNMAQICWRRRSPRTSRKVDRPCVPGP